MRIRFVLLTALLLLSLGLTAGAHRAVMGQKEAVTLEETILEGEPADAAGVTVELRTACLDHLFWDTTLAVGPEGTVRTGYAYSDSGKRTFRPWEPRGIRFDCWGDSGPTREDETEDESGMQKPFNAVAARCPAGTEDYTERVDLSDYYDDFPIYVQDLDVFPGGVSIYVEGESLEQQVRRELRRNFPIAVPKGTWVEIKVDKDADGQTHGYGFSPENVWWPEVECVVTEGGCYFILSTSGQDGGAGLDASRFPLGHGVYLLPLEPMAEPEETAAYGEARRPVRPGPITRVHPVDPGADCVGLFSNADKSLLYLLTRRGGDMALTVLSAADGREVDTLPLFSDVETEGDGQGLTYSVTGDVNGGTNRVTWGYGPRFTDLIVRDGFLVPYLSDGRFAVVTWEGEDYGTALTGSFENLYRNDRGLAQNDWRYEDLPAVDFDGERLAVADFMGYGVNSFFLALYDREGSVFLADYVSSQDLGGARNRVEPLEPRPLTVALPG